ncbi:MAG: hypothetical protein V4693_24375 [Pseudomonadota bacterium]
MQDMRPWATFNLSSSVKPALSSQQQLSGTRSSPLVVGLALSFVLHAALLFAWRQGQPPRPAADAAARAPLILRLRPPPPPTKAEPAPDMPSAARTQSAKPRRRVAPDVIALPEAPAAAPLPPDVFTVEPPEPAAPRFDPDAARKLARKLANEPDPSRAGMAVAQLPKKELETETKAARAIGRAKRRDCKDGIPGGLLAPFILLLDKKDSGCKW